MKRGDAHFNMCGQFLHYPLRTLDEEISPGLAARLVRYAEGRAQDAGFLDAVKGWELEVYTMDGDDRPSERAYGVKWSNPQGGSIELCQILTRNGWPFLDHRWSIDEQ